MRGVTLDGDIVFCCWGRNDMSQLQSSGASSTVIHFPVLMDPPPGKQISAVWCGSEFTVVRAAGTDGEDVCAGLAELWARGWSEHGNLGHGKDSFVEKEWVKTLGRSEGSGSNEGTTSKSVGESVRVGEWEGLVACGGAHCLALVESSC